MKFIFCFLLGLLFIPTFSAFVLLTTLKFRILNEPVLLGALRDNRVYPQLEEFARHQITRQLPNDPATKTLVSSYLKLLTADRLQDIVEKNLTNLIAFLTSKTSDLVFYFPVRELKLPPGAVPPFLRSTTTDQIHFNLRPQLDQLLMSQHLDPRLPQSFGRWLNIGWWASLILLILLLLLRPRLGKVRNTAWWLISEGAILLLLAGAVYFLRVNLTLQLLAGQEPAANLLGIFLPAFVSLLLPLWLILGVAFVGGGVMVFVVQSIHAR